MISAKHATFGYGTQPAVSNVDFHVAPAETVCVVGKSGSGKTTVLKTITGEIPLLSGELLLDGAAQGSDWVRRHVSRTIQSFPLLHWKTVRENLELAAKIGGGPPADIDDVLRQFSAHHLADKLPKALSGGERCRASLAQAALAAPKILLLDEPFTGLDLAVKQEIAEQLFSFAEKFNTSIVFVTHDMLDAATYADRVIVLTHQRPCSIAKIITISEGDALSKIQHAMLGRA